MAARQEKKTEKNPKPTKDMRDFISSKSESRESELKISGNPVFEIKNRKETSFQTNKIDNDSNSQ